MVLHSGERDSRLIESAIARYGENITVPDGSVTQAIPNYEDSILPLVTGEVRHLEGWSLTFRPTIDLGIGDQIQWRDKLWKINDTRPMNTKLWCMVTEIPAP